MQVCLEMNVQTSVPNYQYISTVTEGGADEAADAKLTQADYQRAMGSEVHDPTYINFLTRVERGGRDQVLRYCRMPISPVTPGDNSLEEMQMQVVAPTRTAGTSSSRSNKGLLLLSSDADLLRQRELALKSSPCPRCGAPRTFECQVLAYLLTNSWCNFQMFVFIVADTIGSIVSGNAPASAFLTC